MDEVFGLAWQTNAIPSAELDAQNTAYNYVSGSSAVINDLSDFFQSALPITVTWLSNSYMLNATSNCSAAMIDMTGPDCISVNDVCPSPTTITQSPVIGAALGAGTTNQVVITVTDSAGNAVSSTNWIVVADAAAPIIVSQPACCTNNAGTSTSFSIGATACTALSYQWYQGANALPGQTNSTLNIASVGPANVGNYSVVVTSAGGSTNSLPASLTVMYQAPNVVGGQMSVSASGFQLTFSGPVGQTYAVLSTSDLSLVQSAWTVLGSGVFGSTNVQFTDSAAGGSTCRFYVIKSP